MLRVSSVLIDDILRPFCVALTKKSLNDKSAAYFMKSRVSLPFILAAHLTRFVAITRLYFQRGSDNQLAECWETHL